MRVWIVLPAYNEAANLPLLLNRLREVADNAYRLDLHVLVIDDGSTDDTAAVALRAAQCLPLEVARGQPGSLSLYSFGACRPLPDNAVSEVEWSERH